MKHPYAIVVALISVGLVWPAGQLDAQSSVGGSRGGGGVRGGGVGVSSSRGGSLGSASRIGSGRSTSRGLGGRPSSIGGSGAGTLHPRGDVDAPPSSTDAPSRTVPNRATRDGLHSGTVRTVAPRAWTPRAPAQQSRPPRAGVRRHSVTPTVITVPRAQSIPRMGNSIPPLESHRRSPRAHTDPNNIHGFRGVDFGHRHSPGFPYRFPVVYLPLGYGYRNYASRSEQIVIVDHNTATQSSADVERVPAPAEPPAPVEPKVIEVRPSDADEPATADPRDPTSVEVLRGGRAANGIDETPLYLLAR